MLGGLVVLLLRCLVVWLLCDASVVLVVGAVDDGGVHDVVAVDGVAVYDDVVADVCLIGWLFVVVAVDAVVVVVVVVAVVVVVVVVHVFHVVVVVVVAVLLLSLLLLLLLFGWLVVWLLGGLVVLLLSCLVVWLLCDATVVLAVGAVDDGVVHDVVAVDGLAVYDDVVAVVCLIGWLVACCRCS